MADVRVPGGAAGDGPPAVETLAVEARGLIRIHPSAGGPVAALRGLDLVVRSGEVAAVVGPSGSGKSTLLRLLAGLDRPSSGELRVLGLSIPEATEAELDLHRRDRVAVVEQHYRRSLSPYLPIARAVELPLALRGVPAAVRAERSRDLLARVGLGDRGGALRTELSGGEQQRVALAIALATGPALLLADEPTGELDAATAVGVLELIRELARETDATCVIVTHDEIVERVADRIVLMQDGRAIGEGLAGPDDGADGRPGPDPVAAPRARAATGLRPPTIRRVVDAQGWLAPAAPAPSVPLAAALRPGEDDPAIVLDGAARRFGRDGKSALGLPPTSATFRRGGFHVITGPSGSGKTTLLRLVTGLDHPSSGRVETLGRELAALDRNELAAFRAARIGIVDQARDLVPFLSAAENVELGLAIRGRTGPAATDRARAQLERLGLGGHLDRLPDGLSAGERLRVALARALAAEPELLTLDEPTAALDRAGARHVARLLAEIDPTITVVATTHDPALIEAASDRLDLRAAAIDAA